MTLLKPFLSADVSPTNQPIADVATHQTTIRGTLAGSILDLFQKGRSSIDGTTHDRGWRKPTRINLRRGIEIVE
jgi:hypothetical protein